MSMPAFGRSHLKKLILSNRIEMLEPRCLLNAKMPAQVTIQETPSTLTAGTTELLITGTKKNDSISISDNGTGTAGNIFVSLGTGQDYMSTGAVTEISVPTGTGKDHVTYELDGNLQTPNQELVFVAPVSRRAEGRFN